MEDAVFAIVLLPVALAVIMASLGLSLVPDDFRRVVRLPDTASRSGSRTCS